MYLCLLFICIIILLTRMILHKIGFGKHLVVPIRSPVFCFSQYYTLYLLFILIYSVYRSICTLAFYCSIFSIPRHQHIQYYSYACIFIYSINQSIFILHLSLFTRLISVIFVTVYSNINLVFDFLYQGNP